MLAQFENLVLEYYLKLQLQIVVLGWPMGKFLEKYGGQQSRDPEQ